MTVEKGGVKRKNKWPLIPKLLTGLRHLLSGELTRPASHVPKAVLSKMVLMGLCFVSFPGSPAALLGPAVFVGLASRHQSPKCLGLQYSSASYRVKPSWPSLQQ